MRKLHNALKRQLIESMCEQDSVVLDVGCGRGGDVQKWRSRNLTCVDPDEESLQEARRRFPNQKFILGDISAAPLGPYSIVCYNFSFQYTCASEELFRNTIREIVARTKPGSKLIGVIPDSHFILSQPAKYTDSLGNYFMRNETKTGNGDFGETLWVCVKDTLYYENNDPKPEPIAYKDIIIQSLMDVGFQLDVWKPFSSCTTGFITDMYSEFIFTRIQ